MCWCLCQPALNPQLQERELPRHATRTVKLTGERVSVEDSSDVWVGPATTTTDGAAAATGRGSAGVTDWTWPAFVRGRKAGCLSAAGRAAWRQSLQTQISQHQKAFKPAVPAQQAALPC